MIPVAVGGTAWPWSLPGEGGAAHWLTRLGLKPGDRLALAGLDRTGMAQALAAALRLGVTVVLINRRLAAPELTARLAAARVRLVAADPAHPLAALTTTEPLPSDFGTEPLAGDPAGALVLSTSGTTGPPRAARLDAPAIRAAVAAHVAALDLSTSDRWWLPLPLDHIGGAMGVLRALACGYRLDLGREPPDGFTGASLVPTMLTRLVARGRPWPPGLRRLLTGGGPLPPALAAAATALGLTPSETYGMTEMGSMVTLDGRCIPGAEVRLAENRILVRGPMRFAGYEVDGALHPVDGWHTTGDLGRLESDGRLVVLGRIDELIVSGGENVWAPEVEAVLETHPAVAEAGVVGLPDPEWGEVVAAVVALRGACDPAELAAHCAASLAGFKRPRHWRLVAALPRTALGKLRRGELRVLAAKAE